MKIKSFYKGTLYTVLASLFWGIPQPLFFNEIKFIPAFEIALHRGTWSFFFLFIIILILGRIKEFFLLFKSKKKLIYLTITAILITTNWTGFIFAVSINRVQDASMGYYITPMISIVLGYFFLKEKITLLKLISVLMMFFSLLFLLLSLKTLPVLAILIGLTWGIYGLLRKQIDVKSEIGLLYESGFISVIAAPYIAYLTYNEIGYFINSSTTNSILLILTGAITIFPLFFFNLGVRFIPLGFAGVLFFLTPTLHFLTSAFILNEDINTSKLISFIIIWVAVIIFIIDVLKEEKKINENNIQLPS